MNAAENPTAGLTPEPESPAHVVPPGILKVRAALRRDLPALFAARRTKGKWACYSAEGRVRIGDDYMALVRECLRRGIPDDAFVVERIDARAGSHEEEEIESRNV